MFTCYLAIAALSATQNFGPYTEVRIEGWKVMVAEDVLRDHAPDWAEATSELRSQAIRIRRMLPAAATEKLRKVVIWVNWENLQTKCMAFHPSAAWLREHKMPESFAENIEIGSLANFVSWTKHQPSMLLHELAHAYHWRFVEKGFENSQLKEAFDRAMSAKKYDSVLHANGRSSIGYATTNQMEYFAELTEAYFGTNDMYPFVRAELLAHDPDGCSAIRAAWQDSQSTQSR